MSEKLDKIIQDIAVKHGVLLGKDDPILMLQTMNEHLIEENRKAQQDLLMQFREEMEGISSQWKEDSKEKAEKVLNSALASSKKVMAGLLQETIQETTLSMQKKISDSLAEAHKLADRIQMFGWVVLVGSSTAFIGCILSIMFTLTR